MVHGRMIRDSSVVASHKVVKATECLELHAASEESYNLGKLKYILDKRLTALAG